MSTNPSIRRSGPRRRTALGAAVLALALVAAACGGGGDDPELAETTAAPTSSTSTAVATTTTEPAGPIEPLTGRPLEDDALLEQPVIVVKLGNNDTRSQPHVGINSADIVYEEEIEARATRFAALFHSEIPDVVGPVRSARTTDIDLLANLSQPLLVDSGSNQGTLRLLSAAEDEGLMVRVTDRGAAPFSRDSGRRRPDNLFVDMNAVLDTAPEGATAPQPVFDYGSSFAGLDTAGIVIDARSPVAWVWDNDATSWLRFQDGLPHLADDGSTQVHTDNLVVLFVNYTQSPADPATPQAETVGEGEAWVLRDGQLSRGTWVRPFQGAKFVLMDPSGAPLELTPGRTWVTLARVGGATEIGLDQATALLDTAL